MLYYIWIRTITCQLMPWLLMSPGHLQPGNWCKKDRFFLGDGIQLLVLLQQQEMISKWKYIIRVLQHTYWSFDKKNDILHLPMHFNRTVSCFELDPCIVRPSAGMVLNELISPWTKWLPLCRRYFQMPFLEWKYLYFDEIFTEVCS